jgi:hypothetical protein
MSKQFRPTPIHRAVVQLALLSAGGVALAQEQPQAEADKNQDSQTIVVKGQRAALQSAQKIKQNADEIVDSVVAEERPASCPTSRSPRCCSAWWA